MQYSIKAVENQPPYLCSLPFIAHDYQQWGFDVTSHLDNSDYIKEIRYRERRNNSTRRRPILLQMWAREVLKRGEYGLSATELTGEALRLERDSSMLRDFVKAIAKLGDAKPPRPVKWWSPKRLKQNHVPLPNQPGLDLVTRYLGFLNKVRYNRNIRNRDLPEGSPTNVVFADNIILEFYPHGTPKWDEVITALNEVASRPGRFIKGPERNMTTGMIKVEMWVDVSDCIVMAGSGQEEMVDSPPRYERDEELPAYVDGYMA